MTQTSLRVNVTPGDDDVLAREVLGQVAGRWSLAVLCPLAAADGPLRFSRVLDGVKGITAKVLTQTLRHLERDGFVTRVIYAQVPPRVEYNLTEVGRELIAHVDPLTAWAVKHADTFRAARARFDRAPRSEMPTAVGTPRVPLRRRKGGRGRD